MRHSSSARRVAGSDAVDGWEGWDAGWEGWDADGWDAGTGLKKWAVLF